MIIKFDPSLQANLTIDTDGVVRGINHFQAYMPSEQLSARLAAIDYVRQVADVIDASKTQLARAHQKVSYLDPLEQDIEYRLSEEKTFFDSTTTGLLQTYLNVPVWGAGITVTVKQNPNRIVSAANTSQRGIQAKLPDSEIIEKYRKLFNLAMKGEETAGFARDQFDWAQIKELWKGLDIKDESAREGDRIIRGRFYVYRYDASARLPDQGEQHPRTVAAAGKAEPIRNFEPEYEPTLPLPPVPEAIEDGTYYLVAEIILSLWTPQYERLNWRVLIELETGAVLYLRALTSGVNGMVFVQDPISSTGNATLTPNQSNAVLNPHRTSVVLQNLDAPVGGIQHLRGTYADLQHVHLPNIVDPTEPAGTDFNYNARTDDFAAVNAYYHTDRFFSLVENLGFPIVTYFDGTDFPIPVDHRGRNSTINAHCVGDGDGIDHCCFGLADTPPGTDPLGIAADWRVQLHELGGHGILHNHVNGPNFGFAHSAGDSMAMIVADPESNAPDRFELTPWIPIRRCDRDPAAGWAWGGAFDVGSYSSEQILSTTLFRIYLSIGGGHPSLSRRQFASRMMTYLILRTVGTLTPATNPGNVLAFANAMRAVDLLNWTSEGVFGGAYNKVIRWSFERQGLYQPFGAPTPVTSPGAPPDIDVYIDDGRAGHYDFQHVHWHTTTIWNRRIADGGTTHQEPELGESNYMYVRIKNRGTQAATNVTVRGFHCLPGAGLLWPNDFQAMTTPQIVVGGLGANDTEEKIIGPFEWTPNTNAYGHDCVLMIVSATNDPSNIDNFTAGEVIPEWRLVPNDNNVGQRNVNPVPGGGGLRGLMLGLDGISFWAGNPNPRRATIEIKVTMPQLLTKRGWRLKIRDFPTPRFVLGAQTRREVFIELHPGTDFEPEDVINASDRDVNITVLVDGAMVGGMTYRLDSDLAVPFNRRDRLPDGKKCIGPAKKLLDCLDMPSKDVKCVTVKSVRLDIDFDKDNCDC
ncbi:hypothetical protein V7O66_02775 [Methanolobus sp. ZRKC3]|uniref:hypothetical protein n=1 Tax=Methanolobus sp. ZRKC3 TaxID=3125786 RepID=UPI003247C0C9